MGALNLVFIMSVNSDVQYIMPRLFSCSVSENLFSEQKVLPKMRIRIACSITSNPGLKENFAQEYILA